MTILRAMIAGAIGVLVSSGPVFAQTMFPADLMHAYETDHFNGFEGAQTAVIADESWSEDGISVVQINGEVGGIISDFNPGFREGYHSWYANGADGGYTSITLEDGADMTMLSLRQSNGNGAYRAGIYALLRDGDIVASGVFASSPVFAPITLTNILFDEVWLRNQALPLETTPVFGDGTPNSLAIDSVKVRR